MSRLWGLVAIGVVGVCLAGSGCSGASPTGGTNTSGANHDAGGNGNVSGQDAGTNASGGDQDTGTNASEGGGQDAGTNVSDSGGQDAGTSPTADAQGGVSMGSVGAPCASSAECNTGLTCRMDTTDFVADLQCTAPCASDTDCTSVYGPQTFCIGANVCVQACRDDADCPAKTVCTVNKWCERTGPGSGVPYCDGTPTPCADLPSSQCLDSLGCSSTSSGCSGVPFDCTYFLDSADCTDEQGCTWDFGSNQCTGVSSPCDLIDSSECDLQLGCSLQTGTCSGTPLDCSELPVSTCTSTAGCVAESGE